MATTSLAESLKAAWNQDTVLILESAQPFSLGVDKYSPETKKHHAWYFKKYQDYFYDAHADIQLKHDNLPDVLRNRLVEFSSTTNLNSNYGKLTGADRADFVFPEMAEDSALFCGMFKFSKAFLLENYVVNQDQQVADLIFDSICRYHNLVKDEWVFQSSLHKNTSLFHIHFRMFQIKGTPESHIRQANFTPAALKYTKNEVAKYFKRIQATNNQKNRVDFKLQQAYVRFAQETSLKMNLTSDMLDLALANEDTFNQMFKHWIINFSLVQARHSQQLALFDRQTQQACQALLHTKTEELKAQVAAKKLTPLDYNTQMQKWVKDLTELRDRFWKKWMQSWVFFIATKMVQLWSSKVEDLCAGYEAQIKSGQTYHTLKKADRNLTYLEFCQIPNQARKRYHKGILYLTSMYLFDPKNMTFDDSALKADLKQLTELSTLKSALDLLNQLKNETQELDWQAMTKLVLKEGW